MILTQDQVRKLDALRDAAFEADPTMWGYNTKDEPNQNALFRMLIEKLTPADLTKLGRR